MAECCLAGARISWVVAHRHVHTPDRCLDRIFTRASHGSSIDTRDDFRAALYGFGVESRDRE